jgi:hypothetical protein
MSKRAASAGAVPNPFLRYLSKGWALLNFAAP